MATSKEYADFIRDKFSRLDVVTVKPMMGEYVIHIAGKVLGFIGDEQLLLEPGPTISRLLPDAEYRELFPGSKRFPIIDDAISPAKLCEIAVAIYDDLPASKPRKPKKARAAKASADTGTKARKSSGRHTAEDAERLEQARIEEQFPFAKHIKW